MPAAIVSTQSANTPRRQTAPSRRKSAMSRSVTMNSELR
jgi:hypothetical protein